jgi:hypothetical protein
MIDEGDNDMKCCRNSEKMQKKIDELLEDKKRLKRCGMKLYKMLSISLSYVKWEDSLYNQYKKKSLELKDKIDSI